VRTVLLLLADMTANTGAHICFKLSAASEDDRRRRVRRFILWQVVGNLAAFAGVLAFTGLLRGMSLHVAYPLTEGVTAVGVQVVGGMVVLRERVPLLAWVGTGLILSGIVLLSL
jgi:multidrug transporter EmrE-like cation transporter